MRTSESILFSTLSLPSDCLPSSVTVGTHQIAFSDKVRNLGSILDSNLTMKQHVIKVCQTAYYEQNASVPPAATSQKMQQKS